MYRRRTVVASDPFGTTPRRPYLVVSDEVLETHYDQRSQKDKMEQRRQYLDRLQGREERIGSFIY